MALDGAFNTKKVLALTKVKLLKLTILRHFKIPKFNELKNDV